MAQCCIILHPPGHPNKKKKIPKFKITWLYIVLIYVLLCQRKQFNLFSITFQNGYKNNWQLYIICSKAWNLSQKYISVFKSIQSMQIIWSSFYYGFQLSFTIRSSLTFNKQNFIAACHQSSWDFLNSPCQNHASYVTNKVHLSMLRLPD